MKMAAAQATVLFFVGEGGWPWPLLLWDGLFILLRSGSRSWARPGRWRRSWGWSYTRCRCGRSGLRILDCCVVIIGAVACAIAGDYDIAVVVDGDRICAVVTASGSGIQLIPLFHTVCVVLDCHKIGGATSENETAYVNVGGIIQSD